MDAATIRQFQTALDSYLMRHSYSEFRDLLGLPHEMASMETWHDLQMAADCLSRIDAAKLAKNTEAA